MHFDYAILQIGKIIIIINIRLLLYYFTIFSILIFCEKKDKQKFLRSSEIEERLYYLYIYIYLYEKNVTKRLII